MIPGILAPSDKTLKKYGLTLETWAMILHRQGGVCAVCKKMPTTGRLNIDHNHVPKWKKLPPEKRALHVRGLLCFFCNRYYCGRAINVFKSQNVTEYLRAHEDRIVAHALKGAA